MVGRIAASSRSSSREVYIGANGSERLAELLRAEWSVALVVWLSPILVLAGRSAESRMLVAWRARGGGVHVSFDLGRVVVPFFW